MKKYKKKFKILLKIKKYKKIKNGKKSIEKTSNYELNEYRIKNIWINE